MSPQRIPEPKEYCHERLGEVFQVALSSYDTERRVEVLVDDFLSDDMLNDKDVLDVGCGLGFFSKRLRERGARVLACDLGPHLVERTRAFAGCEGMVADAMELSRLFAKDRFDVVVSSECIEHTPDPLACVREMVAVLKPGGFLSVSTPNIVWQPAVRLASALRFRPFDGYENFSSWGRLAHAVEACGVRILEKRGLHLFPFQFGLHQLSRICDRRLQVFRPAMIGICILGQKAA